MGDWFLLFNCVQSVVGDAVRDCATERVRAFVIVNLRLTDAPSTSTSQRQRNAFELLSVGARMICVNLSLRLRYTLPFQFSRLDAAWTPIDLEASSSVWCIDCVPRRASQDTYALVAYAYRTLRLIHPPPCQPTRLLAHSDSIPCRPGRESPGRIISRVSALRHRE